MFAADHISAGIFGTERLIGITADTAVAPRIETKGRGYVGEGILLPGHPQLNSGDQRESRRQRNQQISTAQKLQEVRFGA